MYIKGIVDEDFLNYKKPSMIIAFPYCSFKCDKEYGQQVCQNSELVSQKNINVWISDICSRYLKNNITQAIVFQGLEPFDSYDDMCILIDELRCTWKCNDDIVIYTGYTEEELKEKTKPLIQYPNIIIKYGRYVPNQNKHYDDVLGIYLASDNQYAVKIS